MKKCGLLLTYMLTIVSLFPQVKNRTLQEYYDSGEKYIDSGEFDAAIRVHNDGLVVFPDDSLLYSGLAFAYYKKGDIETAINFCNKAINCDTNNERPYRYLGYIYADKKDYHRAVEYFTRSIYLLPTRSTTYTNRGSAYGALGDTNNAISDYQRALELDPGNDNLCALLAALFYGRGAYSNAISFANRALEKNPNNSLARNVLSTAENDGVSISERGIAKIDVSIQIGATMSEYMKKYPYLQADALNSLVDKRSMATGVIITYTFNSRTKKLALVSFADYSSTRLDMFNNYLTEWTRNGDELHESNDQTGKIILNMTPLYQTDGVKVFLSLARAGSMVALSYSILYDE